MSGSDASLDEAPFEYLRVKVYPKRTKEKNKKLREFWWLFERPRPKMCKALSGLSRYIATPRVSKHRLFVWIDAQSVPDTRVLVFASESEYFFGVLHSRLHEIWSLATSSRHGDGNEGGRPTYNATTCFETFPFPWPPGAERKVIRASRQSLRLHGN